MNNTIDKLLNNEIETLTQYVESYVVYRKFNAIPVEVEKQLLENSKNYNISLKEFDELVVEEKRKQDRVRKSGIEKISESRFVRSYIRTLEKSVGFKNMSKNRCSVFLAEHVMGLLEGVSEATLKNYSSREYVDVVLELISDEDLLKEQFDTFISKTLVLVMEGKNTLDTMHADLRSQYFIPYFAKCIISYLNEEDLSEAKEELTMIMETSIDVIQKHLTKQMEEEEKIEEERLQSMLKMIEEETQTEEEIEEEYDEFELEYVRNPKLYEIYEFHKTKLLKTYNTYFKLEEADHFEFYVDLTVSALHSQRVKKKDDAEVSDFEVLILSTIREDIEFYTTYHHMDTDIDTLSIVGVFLEMEYLNLLAYSIRKGANFSFNKQKEIYDYFKDIFYNNEICHEKYEYINNVYDNLTSQWGFNAVCEHQNKIIMAVIMCIDHKVIENKIKQFISTYSTYTVQDLPALNKKYTQMYENMKLSENDTFDCAIIFLLNYFYNAVYLCPYCAFSSYAKGQINDRNIIDDTTYETYIFNYVNGNIEGVVPVKVREIVDKLKEEIETLLDQVTYDEQFKIYMKYRHASVAHFWTMSKNSASYLMKQNVVALCKKYLCHLISSIYIYFYKFKRDEKFEELSKEEKLDLLYNWALSFSLYDEIETDKFLLEDVSDYKSKANLYKLENENKNKEEEITRLNKTIEDLNKEIKVIKNKNLVNKDIASLSKIHYEEISKYKQEINKLKEKVASFKEKETELYKLREMLFNQSDVEEEINEEDAILLSDLLKEKDIVLVGGHSKFLKKMKAKYPTIKIYNNENMPTSMLLKADYVFFLNNFVSHSTYFNVMNVLEKNESIPYDFINHTNVEMAEEIIYRCLTK